MYSVSYQRESFMPTDRHERYKILDEMYSSMSVGTIRCYEPHQSIPIRKMRIELNKRYDFIYELLYKYQKKKAYEREDNDEKVAEINDEISNYLKEVFLRTLWMINRNISLSDPIIIGSTLYTVKDSMIKIFEGVIDFIDDNDDYYQVQSFIMKKIYILDFKVIQHLDRIYYLQEFKPFIEHFNMYIKRNLVE